MKVSLTCESISPKPFNTVELRFSRRHEPVAMADADAMPFAPVDALVLVLPVAEIAPDLQVGDLVEFDVTIAQA